MAGLKFIHINVNHSPLSHRLAFVTAGDLGVDFLFISEPYYYSEHLTIQHPPSWRKYASDSINSIIYILNPDIVARLNSTSLNTTRVLIGSGTGNLLLISAYFPPRGKIETQLGELESGFINDVDTIVLGDFNCPHVGWGYSNSAPRGKKMIDFLILHGLTFANVIDGLTTFESCSGAQGNPDLTLVSQHLFDKISEWRVLDKDALSDHRYVYFNLILNESFRGNYFNYNFIYKTFMIWGVLLGVLPITLIFIIICSVTALLLLILITILLTFLTVCLVF